MIKYVQSRADKEKACYKLRQMVYQDRIESVHRAKYGFEHMMLVLKQTKARIKKRAGTNVQGSMHLDAILNISFICK